MRPEKEKAPEGALLLVTPFTGRILVGATKLLVRLSRHDVKPSGN